MALREVRGAYERRGAPFVGGAVMAQHEPAPVLHLDLEEFRFAGSPAVQHLRDHAEALPEDEAPLLGLARGAGGLNQLDQLDLDRRSNDEWISFHPGFARTGRARYAAYRCTEKAYELRCRYCSPGRSTVDGKAG